MIINKAKEKTTGKNNLISAYNKTFCIVEGLEEYWNYKVTVTAHTIKGDNISTLFPVVTHQAGLI